MIRFGHQVAPLVALALFVLVTEGGAVEKSKHVLILGIDGVRPDALKVANTPNIDSLIANGTYAANTDIIAPRETTSDTVSGPGWSNLLTGVWSDKHGTLDNDFKGTHYDQYPHFFARLKEAQPRAFTASISTWKPIEAKIVSAADINVDYEQKDKDYQASDKKVAGRALEVLGQNTPTAIVVYFGQVDETGHKHGFHPSVPEYIAAIERVDAHVGEVMAAVRGRKSFANEDWLTIVCTDHGGQGKNHSGGRTTPEIRNVFLVVSGDAAAKGILEAPTYQVDVVGTALKHLGVIPKDEWKLDGKPIGLK
jgi:predicted AlkP superfamily pyrophosphatase or phosphodiesterase